MASGPKLEWSRDGRGIVSCIAGMVRLHDATGGVVRELAGARVLDVRWREDGRILALDNRGTLTWRAAGVLVDQHNITFLDRRPHTASIAGDGRRFVAVSDREVFVASIGGERVWTLDAQQHDIAIDFQTSAILAGDGARVAIGYGRRERGRWSRDDGRGWVVIELATQEALDRAWTTVARAPGYLQLAFDRHGKRLLHAAPEAGEQVGVIRLGRGEPFLPTCLAGSRAAALDDNGVIAAYGYAGGAPLRVDYLSPERRGPAQIEVLDTLRLDPGLPDLLALAFSADSHGLACLAADGSIEVVPVP